MWDLIKRDEEVRNLQSVLNVGDREIDLSKNVSCSPMTFKKVLKKEKKNRRRKLHVLLLFTLKAKRGIT